MAATDVPTASSQTQVRFLALTTHPSLPLAMGTTTRCVCAFRFCGWSGARCTNPWFFPVLAPQRLPRSPPSALSLLLAPYAAFKASSLAGNSGSWFPMLLGGHLTSCRCCCQAFVSADSVAVLCACGHSHLRRCCVLYCVLASLSIPDAFRPYTGLLRSEVASLDCRHLS